MLHQATLFVAASCLVIGGVMFLWKNNQSSIVDVNDYLLTADKIEMPQPPPVGRSRSSRVDSGRPGDRRLSWIRILVSDTADEIKRMPFVDQINSISKSKSGVRNKNWLIADPVAIVFNRLGTRCLA